MRFLKDSRGYARKTQASCCGVLVVIRKAGLMGQFSGVSGALLCALALAGCANNTPQQEQAGLVIGGVLGGVLGSQIGQGDGRTTAIILGTLAGTAIGGAIGRSMAETDRIKAAQALESVRTGVSTAWRNPDSGNEYALVPTRTYDTPAGPCREYTIDASVAGKKDKIFGTACRQTDGSWQIRN
jgi:surface antigen